MGASRKALGHVALQLEGPEKAVALLQQAREIFDTLDVPSSAATACRVLADAYQTMGDVDSALSMLRQALALFEKVGSHEAATVRQEIAELTGSV